MKLVRYGAPGKEKPGIIDADGKIRDLSKIVADIDAAALSPKGLATIRKANLNKLKVVPGKPRLGPCVARKAVGNFIAIGLNYADHAEEAGMPLPKEPIIFNKAPSSICGPNDNTIIPKGSSQLDYEVELGIVIGSRALYLSKEKAMSVVAGYCIGNDVSERDFQINRAGTWIKGKGAPTFGPLGPWMVTKDEIKNPQNLKHVARRQRAETPARQHQDHGVRCRAYRLVLLAILRDGAGRRHRHRHAAGRRARHEAGAGMAQGRRRGHPRHPGARRAEAEGRGRKILIALRQKGKAPGAGPGLSILRTAPRSEAIVQAISLQFIVSALPPLRANNGRSRETGPDAG